ncbi:MAG: protein kinase [Candidatus Acidiferrum sp.]
MADFWKRCEGRVIEQKYPLHQFLGGTPSSGVFLTSHSAAPAEKAVIKFILAHPGMAKLYLSRWARAARLSHPNLLQLWDSGRCGLDGRDLLYVVLEYAEENLSQILPERALTPEETREMVVPVMEALIYLHGQGLAHGHLKPSNVHAIGEQIKLSVDSVTRLGELHLGGRGADSYSAPELLSSPVTGVSDVWSFGITLVEALTQHAPDVPAARHADPKVPPTLPQPFLDIARHALRCDPALRWTPADIAAHLKPGHVMKEEAPSVPAVSATPAKATAAKLSPLDVPLSPERGIPVAKLAAVPPRVMPPQRKPNAPAKKTLLFPNYTIPLLAAIFVLAAIVLLPKFLRHQQQTPTPATPSAQVRSEAKPTDHARNQTLPAPQPKVKDSARAVVEKAPPASAAPATLRTEIPPAAPAARLASDSPARGEVLDQVLPEVPGKALNTIHGVVRVSVRVHVDAAGNVSQAELEAPGPSRYFADLALKAAGKWVFGSPELEGRSVPSEWLIRFDFAQSGVVASPQQTSP